MGRTHPPRSEHEHVEDGYSGHLGHLVHEHFGSFFQVCPGRHISRCQPRVIRQNPDEVIQVVRVRVRDLTVGNVPRLDGLLQGCVVPYVAVSENPVWVGVQEL